MANQWDQAILEAKKQWAAANAKGDKAGMAKAHQMAEEARKKGGTIGANIDYNTAYKMVYGTPSTTFEDYQKKFTLDTEAIQRRAAEEAKLEADARRAALQAKLNAIRAKYNSARREIETAYSGADKEIESIMRANIQTSDAEAARRGLITSSLAMNAQNDIRGQAMKELAKMYLAKNTALANIEEQNITDEKNIFDELTLLESQLPSITRKLFNEYYDKADDKAFMRAATLFGWERDDARNLYNQFKDKEEFKFMQEKELWDRAFKERQFKEEQAQSAWERQYKERALAQEAYKAKLSQMAANTEDPFEKTILNTTSKILSRREYFKSWADFYEQIRREYLSGTGDFVKLPIEVRNGVMTQIAAYKNTFEADPVSMNAPGSKWLEKKKKEEQQQQIKEKSINPVKKSVYDDVFQY